MQCPNIQHIKFSTDSLKALDEIKRIKQLSVLLSSSMVSGTLSTIFLGANSLTTTYSVYSADFDSLTRALKAVPIITRTLIERIAGETYLSLTDYKEKKFWKAVYLGCKVNKK